MTDYNYSRVASIPRRSDVRKRADDLAKKARRALENLDLPGEDYTLDYPGEAEKMLKEAERKLDAVEKALKAL